MREFDLIARYFSWNDDFNKSLAQGIALGVGDDAAVLDVPAGSQLVTSIDTLISGVHFPKNTAAHAIGHKALAVNLSDLAAMGATPAWFTLALTLPEINTDWLDGFNQGLKTLAQQHRIALVGGDTTQGPLSISIQAMGFVDKGKAMLRSGAKAGDRLYVTGSLGDAAAGLQAHLDNLELPEADRQYCRKRLDYPQARLAESRVIKDYAGSCIDVSDGLLQDLTHILQASGRSGVKLGAKLDSCKLPLSAALKRLDQNLARQFALSGGDDYELLFSIPQEKEAQFLEAMARRELVGVSCIGEITDCESLMSEDTANYIVDENNTPLKPAGYNHFHEQ